MSYIQIGRLLLSAPLKWQEALGDPVTNLGGAPIPAPRSALRHLVSIATFEQDGVPDTVAARLTNRRQLRSMLNNSPLKLQGGFYVLYGDDAENSGWYVPDTGSLADLDGSSGLATGVWQLEGVAWLLAGHRRLNLEARNVWLKDLRTGTRYRDFLRRIYSTDFAALTALPLTTFPPGATNLRQTVSGQRFSGSPMPAGDDGYSCLRVAGLPDLACVSYSRDEAYMAKGDVVVYDRRGNIGLHYRATVLEDLPASYWRLDETSGTTAADAEGYAPATYAGGVTLAQAGALALGGDTDKAIALDGLSGYVDAGVASGLAPLGGITAECWFKTTSSALMGLVGHYVPSNGYLLRINAGQVSFLVEDHVAGTSGTYNDGSWHHAVGTYDGSFVRIYIDGVQIAATAYGGALAYGAEHCLIGQWAGGNFFSGSLDEVAVYPAALSALRVSQHYQAGIAGTPNASAYADYGWEEAYGPDWPWSWQQGLAAADAPVLSNGLVRVRYDILNNPGFRVDVYDATKGWVEQGKILVFRSGDSAHFDNTWVSASLAEYTQERAVAVVTLQASADPASAEDVYITLQRGEQGVTFEVYPALRADGTTLANAAVVWQWAPYLGSPDADEGAMVSVTQSLPPAAGTGTNVSTAGSGGSQFGALGLLGPASFSASENYVALLPCPPAYNVAGAWQATLVPLAGTRATAKVEGSRSAGYGQAQNAYRIESLGPAGYVFARLAFGAASADQVMEAEAMTLGAGTTAGGDPSASGGATTQASRGSDANAHVTRAAWPNGTLGKYRVFAHVKTTATQGSFYAKTGATTGATVTVAGAATPTYAWIDLGDIVSDGSAFEGHAWVSSGSGIVEVDRYEAYLVEDRLRVGATYSGSRDYGQAALYDSRQMGALVAR